MYTVHKETEDHDLDHENDHASNKRRENIDEWVQKEMREFDDCDKKFYELQAKVISKSKLSLIKDHTLLTWIK